MTNSCQRSHSRRRRCVRLLGLAWLVVSPSSGAFFVTQPSSPSSQQRSIIIRRLPSSSSSSLATSLSTSEALQQQGQQQKRTNNNNNNNNINSNTPLDRQIVALGRKGQIDAALQLFDSIKRPTIRQVNAILDACGRAQRVRLSTALEIFNKYCPPPPKQTATATQQQSSSSSSSSPSSSSFSLQPNVYTFGALMTVCARAHDVDQAMQLFETMKRYRIRPNGVVYNAAISACANTLRTDLAMQLLEQAEQQQKHNNITLSVVGYNAAISAAAKSGDYQMALQLVERMKVSGPSPDAVTYGTVLAACERAQQWSLVVEQAQHMHQQGFAWDGLAFSSVLHACQQLGWWQLALEYLQQMKTADTYYQRQTAGWDIAGNKQPLQGPDAVAYRLVISACARGGAWQEGIRVLDEYCDLYNGGDVVAYTSAIAGCQYEGKWVPAFQLLDRMRRANVQPNQVTFAAVIHACATATTKLVSSSTTATSATNQTEFPDPHVKAMRLFSVLKKDPSVPDPTIQVYNAAIRSCAEALDMERAFAIFDELRDNGIVPNIITYGALMTACERKESIEHADKVFQMMMTHEEEGNLQPNEIIYGAAISCCRKARDPERAFGLLKKMIREDSLEPNVAVFNTVIMAQAESTLSSPEENMERAMAVFKILKSQEYTAASPDRRTYNILIRIMAANKNPRQAESLLRQMQEDGFVPDVDLFTATVSSYERKGQPLKALQLMESMRANGYDFYESPVLNSAFKKAVSLVNAVGRNLATSEKEEGEE